MNGTYRPARVGLLLALVLGTAWALTPGIARAEVKASGDENITVITNDVGKFFIARRCISSVGGGDPNGSGGSIGPGYIYRMDIANKEVLAPEKAGEPQTGLGLFQLDVYREQDKSDRYSGFRALQGNICRGDPNGIFFSEGAGVVPKDDFRDDAGGGPVSQTYIWLHYTVDLADPHGVVLIRLQYKWRFYSRLVQLWTRITSCPNGCNNATEPPAGDPSGIGYEEPPSSYPYAKMPRYTQVVAGSREMVLRYTSISCYTADGTQLMTATNISNPQVGTAGNHCSEPSRDYVKLHSDGTIPSLRIVGRAYPHGDPGNPGSSWVPWEAEPGGCGRGVDLWAVKVRNDSCGDNRPNGDEEADGPEGSNTGCRGTTPTDGEARNWELLGDSRTGGQSSYKLATNGADAAGRGVYMKGWEDGVGPNTCPGLYSRFGPTGERYANYFSYLLE